MRDPSPGSGDWSEGEACIANIGPKERRKRLIAGVIFAILALVALVALVAMVSSRWWRLTMVLPVWVSAIGFLQARGIVEIGDAGELEQVRQQAHRVHVKSALAAILLSLATLAIPGVD